MHKRIENWAVIVRGADMYTPPEAGVPCLIGTVPGDSRRTVTSGIAGKRNGCVVTRSDNEYELGEVDAKYAAQYPDAKARLLGSLPELRPVV